MSYKKPRINDLKMTTIDVVKVMAGGNPGALTVCMKLLSEHKEIDPRAAFGGLGAMMSLDTLDIYEDKIWIFYKDVCHENLSVMCAVMRAHQLGQLEGCTEQAIHTAIDNYGKGLDLKKICAAVKERLPEFQIKSE